MKNFRPIVLALIIILSACSPATVPDTAAVAFIPVVDSKSESIALLPPPTITPTATSTRPAINGFKFDGMLSRYTDGTIRLYGILTHMDRTPLGGTFVYFLVGDEKPQKIDAVGIVDYSMDFANLPSLTMKVTDAANGDSCSMALPTVVYPEGTHVNESCEF